MSPEAKSLLAEHRRARLHDDIVSALWIIAAGAAFIVGTWLLWRFG